MSEWVAIWVAFGPSTPGHTLLASLVLLRRNFATARRCQQLGPFGAERFQCAYPRMRGHCRLIDPLTTDSTRREVVAANDLPEYYLTIYDGARGDPCLHAVRRTLLAPGHQAHDPELLQEIGKRRTRKRA